MTNTSRSEGPEVAEAVAEAVALASSWRRALHQIPELAFQEKKSSAFVRQKLAGLGLRMRAPMIGTDVVADLDVPRARVRLGLRADLDALPMEEAKNPPWRSRHPGFMHACGHDGHTAILLASARALSRLKAKLRVNVRFIFQPGEEVKCGAVPLVKAGALRGVDELFALHGWPGIPVGKISSRAGAIFAAGFFFRIELRGRGTHGATPEKGRNPLGAAGEIALAIEDLHAKWNGRSGAVVSLCQSNGGTASNVIPSTTTLAGTFRSLSPLEGPRIEADLRAAITGICRKRAIAVKIIVDRSYRYPVMNSAESVQRIRGAAASLGRGVWMPASAPSMASEDFAHMLRKVPGAMFRLGLGEKQPPLHAPAFDFPDAALANGVGLFVALALGRGLEPIP